MDDPNDKLARDTLRAANEYCRRGQWDDAIAAYRLVLQRKPDSVDAHCNLGVALCQKGDLEAGLAAQRRAIELQYNCVQAYNNLGSALSIAGRFDEAAVALDRAIELQPGMAEAHFTRSLIRLAHGEFDKGWDEYEWRLRARGPFMHKGTAFRQPRWDGQDLNGKTILLHAEAGFGDSIQFVRYAPLVAKRGGKVIVGCQPELATLFSRVPGIVQIVTPVLPLARFDVHCPLMSLPLAFKTTAKAIPWNGPYLHADANRAQHWKERMGDGFKIGIAWKGDAQNRLDRWRSIEWKCFGKILSAPGARFFSLQKGQVPPAHSQLIDWTIELKDFSETAALVANLDLVVTVDTAVAHLAGAMGKPVWVLISASPDCRWMLDRQDTAWYPSMRLFRQKKLGEWDAVVDRMLESLTELWKAR